MRRAKRVLIFAGEMAISAIGSAASLSLGAVAALTCPSCEDTVFCLVSLTALLLAGWGFLAFRRRTRTWRTEYACVARMRRQALRMRHPGLARIERIALRVSVSIPSLIAALVLFFYPITSHLVHPLAGDLGPYYVSIPWPASVFTWTDPHDEYGFEQIVLSNNGRGRFGMTPFLVVPFWNRAQKLSGVTLQFSRGLDTIEPRWGHEPNAIERRFPLPGGTITCWQSRDPYAEVGQLKWNVFCNSTSAVHHAAFAATFRGYDIDLPTFCRMIEGITPGL